MGIKVVRRNCQANSENTQGSYAISSIGARPWSSTSVLDHSGKTRRAKTEPTVLYPIFKECAELTDDPTWRSIFRDAAFGKFPRGFSMKDGYLVHKIRNRVSRLEISKTPEEVFDECTKFFKEKAGIMSEEDQRRNQREYENQLITLSESFPQQWSQIRKKRLREVLLSTYISRLTKEYSLTPREKENLRNTIRVGLILGCFKNKQIILNRGYIEEIKGLVFDPDKRKFSIDYREAPKQISRTRRVDTPTKPKHSFYNLWLKFLSNLEKEIYNKADNRTSKSVENSSYDPITSNEPS